MAQVMNVIGEVSGKTCVLIDDLVDTAGTLCEASRILKERGAVRVVAYITHPVLSGPAVERIEKSELDELVVTNTIPLSETAKACTRIRQLSVAQILAEMRLDPVTVAAGLLHDTVEDTYATQAEIRDQFGGEVEELVAGLTKISKIAFESREERQAENFRKMLLAMSKDVRIILIKLADRLHNMRTLKYMDDSARERVSRETLDIYAPLAHRIGIYWIKQELEEKAFEVLYPEVAREIEKSRGPFKVSCLSEKAAVAALQDEDGWAMRTIAECIATRERLFLALKERGLEPLLSLIHI